MELYAPYKSGRHTWRTTKHIAVIRDYDVVPWGLELNKISLNRFPSFYAIQEYYQLKSGKKELVPSRMLRLSADELIRLRDALNSLDLTEGEEDAAED